MKKTYTMVVKDRAGVLSRITAYIRRNGWNVAQVHVTPIAASEQSSMSLTIAFTKSEAQRFEQRLREWNFIFEISGAEQEDEQ